VAATREADVGHTREDGDGRLSVPLWLPALTLLLAVAGIAVAAYLTDAHYNEHLVLACPDTGTINCAAVTTSPESKVFGIPVALLGLLYFVSIPVLLVPAAWRSPSVLIRRGRMLASGVGVLFILWLIYAELFRIEAICLYCTAVHVITVLLFAVVAVGTALTAPLRDEEFED